MSTQARFTDNVGVFDQGRDNTHRIRTEKTLTPAYAASIVVDTRDVSNTLVVPAALTGALSITINVGTSTTPPFVGDVVDFMFVASGADRIVTFSTGFASAGTLTVVSAKYGSIRFRFNGTAWQESGRALTA
jgi:hypothetical protein